MDELELVKLIEAMLAKFSPAAKERWGRLKLMIETVRPDDDITPELVDMLKGTRNLPPEDHVTWRVSTELYLGLRAADFAARRWGADWGRTLRRAAVIKAAQEKVRLTGGIVEPDMTLREALDRLRA